MRKDWFPINALSTWEVNFWWLREEVWPERRPTGNDLNHIYCLPKCVRIIFLPVQYNTKKYHLVSTRFCMSKVKFHLCPSTRRQNEVKKNWIGFVRKKCWTLFKHMIGHALCDCPRTAKSNCSQPYAFVEPTSWLTHVSLNCFIAGCLRVKKIMLRQ